MQAAWVCCGMGQENAVVLLAMFAAAGYVAWLWWKDYSAANRGEPTRGALPGAVPARRAAIVVGGLGGVLLVGLETAGEYALGIQAQQSTITWLFALYTLAAAFVEELIFRGYVVVTNRGRTLLVASVVGASAIFAALHPFLWKWEDGSLQWVGGTKAWFSTCAVFLASLWFYYVRFFRLNPTRSLVPCIVAHAAKNAGVIAVKFFQGFVAGTW